MFYFFVLFIIFAVGLMILFSGVLTKEFTLFIFLVCLHLYIDGQSSLHAEVRWGEVG